MATYTLARSPDSSLLRERDGADAKTKKQQLTFGRCFQYSHPVQVVLARRERVPARGSEEAKAAWHLPPHPTELLGALLERGELIGTHSRPLKRAHVPATGKQDEAIPPGLRV